MRKTSHRCRKRSERGNYELGFRYMKETLRERLGDQIQSKGKYVKASRTRNENVVRRTKHQHTYKLTNKLMTKGWRETYQFCQWYSGPQYRTKRVSCRVHRSCMSVDYLSTTCLLTYFTSDRPTDLPTNPPTDLLYTRKRLKGHTKNHSSRDHGSERVSIILHDLIFHNRQRRSIWYDLKLQTLSWKR